MAFPRPLALGLVHLPPRATDRARAQARLEVALAVNALGYGLVETFALGESRGADDAALGAMEELVAAVEVQAIVLHGPIEAAVVLPIADRARLVILNSPGLSVVR